MKNLSTGLFDLTVKMPVWIAAIFLNIVFPVPQGIFEWVNQD